MRECQCTRTPPFPLLLVAASTLAACKVVFMLLLSMLVWLLVTLGALAQPMVNVSLWDGAGKLELCQDSVGNVFSELGTKFLGILWDFNVVLIGVNVADNRLLLDFGLSFSATSLIASAASNARSRKRSGEQGFVHLLC